MKIERYRPPVALRLFIHLVNLVPCSLHILKQSSAWRYYRERTFLKSKEEFHSDRDPSCSLSSIQLNNWGLFHDETLNFPQLLGFTAITGETGSGKSVFLSSLRYLFGEIAFPKSWHVPKETHPSVVASLSCYEGTFREEKRANELKWKRKYFPLSRRSSYSMIDPISHIESPPQRQFPFLKKNLPSSDENPSLPGDLRLIKFWSPRSITRLSDSIEFLKNYVDPHIAELFLRNPKQDHLNWLESYQRLQYLEQIQAKYQQSPSKSLEDQVDLQSHYLTEIQSFFDRILSFQESVLLFLRSELSPHDDIMKGEQDIEHIVRDFIENRSSNGISRRLNISDVCIILDWSIKQLRDLSVISSKFALESHHLTGNKKETSKVLFQSMLLLEIIFKEIEDTVFSATSDDSLESIDKQLQKIVQSLQLTSRNYEIGKQNLEHLGLVPSSSSELFSNLENELNRIISTMRLLNNGTKKMKALYTSNWKDISKKCSNLKSEWETLAKKYRIPPSFLKFHQMQLKKELMVIQNSSILISQEESKEKELRKLLIHSMRLLAERRLDVLQSTLFEINKVLPLLEIGEFILIATMNSPALTDSDSLLEMKRIQFYQDFASCDIDNISLQVFRNDGSQESHRSLGSLVSLSNGSKKVERHDGADHLEQGRKTQVESILEQLSSGEAARTALAFEIISSTTGSDRSILVFDEIDAHIGGTASVAVAKLLKQIGRARQVFVVTHNPIIAASADYHIQVQKESSFPPVSSLKLLLNRTDRELELSRMAVGKLNITAGIDLAKALLQNILTF